MIEILAGLGVLTIGLLIFGLIIFTINAVIKVLMGVEGVSNLEIFISAIVLTPVVLVGLYEIGTVLYDIGHNILKGIGFYT